MNERTLEGDVGEQDGHKWADAMAELSTGSEAITQQHREIVAFFEEQAKKSGTIAEIYLQPNGGYQSQSRELLPGEDPGVHLVHEPFEGPEWDYGNELQKPEGSYEVRVKDGGVVWMDEARFERFTETGVEPELYLRHETMLHDVDLAVKMLDGSDLAVATGEALKKRCGDILQVAREVGEGKHQTLSEAEVARAQRDLAFLVGALTVALGARSFQEGVEHGIHVTMESGRRMGQGRYTSVFVTSYWALDDEGDFEDLVGEERDFALNDGLLYRGTLSIEIDPAKRINLSYVPEQESAKAHYIQEVRREQDGVVRVHPVSGLSVRLDMDKKAPEELSLDVARSKFESETFGRPGDLVGEVLAAGSPDGSHTYDGFAREMVGQFRPMAEELVVHQYLMWQREQDRKVGRRPREEELDADIRRYVENQAPWQADSE